VSRYRGSRTGTAGSPLRVGACLSLSGRYARFGSQAAQALQAWAALDGDAELVIEDDRSDPGTLQISLPRVAAGCDVLLGPYSTQLARDAGTMAAAAGWLVWNHGGSGDDVQVACPGHVVSLLTPASRYTERFIRDVVVGTGLELWIRPGKGSFGRQVADGAQKIAGQAGARTRRLADGASWPDPAGPWALVSAGTFEDDVQAVSRARRRPDPPRLIFSVAAGVHEFAGQVDDPEGIYGVTQWFPGRAARTGLGPAEDAFLAAYAAVTGQPADYPGVQAAAAAVIAAHCARQARCTARRPLWAQATALDTSTLFGGFRIDPVTGAQVKHETALVRWTSDGLALA
jgi:ABC-type branched-subunit amino acid transport system substrate-binding protein